MIRLQSDFGANETKHSTNKVCSSHSRIQQLSSQSKELTFLCPFWGRSTADTVVQQMYIQTR